MTLHRHYCAHHGVMYAEGIQGFPQRTPVFKYPMKMKLFGLSETKLFHFHGIFKKNEIKSAKRTPTPLYL